MKNLLGKLKGMKFKKTVVEHGEKFALAVIAIIALVCCWTSLRAGYPRTPEQMVELAKKSLEDLKRSTIPEEELAKFSLSGAYQHARDLLFKPMESDIYAYGTPGFPTPMFWPVIRPKEQIKDPEFRPVEELVVASGKTVLELAAQTTDAGNAPEMDDSGTASDSKTLAGTDDPDLARPENRKDVRKPAAAAPAAGDLLGEDINLGGGLRRGAAAEKAEARTRRGGDTSKKKDTDTKKAKEAPPPHDQSRGARYVAVRGIFDLKKQLKSFQNANIPNPTIDMIEFVDFELERQRAIEGDDPWSGPWEQVDLDVANQILDETADFTADVVDPMLKDGVITMPLPQRLIGRWTDVASHPKIKDYQLSEEAQADQRKLDEQLMDKFNELGADQTAQKGPQKKGFSGQQVDYRTALKSVETATTGGRGRGAQRNNPGMRMGRAGTGFNMDNVSDMLGTDMRRGGAGRFGSQATTAAGMTGGPSPVGKWILFRFIDFDVEPGEAYRYRVRLTLVNPNYQREIGDVTDPSVIANDTRKTKWSEPSPIAIIQEDTKLFLTKIDHRKSNDSGRTWIEIFQWDPKVGTTITETLDIVLGQIIGKRNVMSLYLDLAIPSFQKEPVSFITRDILVDSYLSPEVLASLHPDLDLKVKGNEKRPQAVGIPDQAAVVDRYGQLVAYDSVTNEDGDLKQAKNRLEVERKDYVDLLEDAKKAKKDKEDKDKKANNPMRRRRGRGGRGGGGGGGRR